MTVFWIWYRHWQRTIISSSEYSQTATGNVTQTSTVVSTAKIFAVYVWERQGPQGSWGNPEGIFVTPKTYGTTFISDIL